MFTAIKRFLIIFTGYVLAVVIAALGASAAIHLSNPVVNFDPSFLVFFGFAALFIGIFASVPAGLAICFGEYWPVRSWWYYMAVAVLAGLALGQVFATEWWLPVVGAVLGIASGGAYWAVAGKNAGILKTSETARAQTHLLLLLGSTAIIIAALMLVYLR